MISVIIPTRWTWSFDKLKRLLQSLALQTIIPTQVLIIIDFDVPKKPLQDMITEWCNNYSLWDTLGIEICCQDGYGVSSARNWWVKKSFNDYLLVCDDDIELQDKRTLELFLDHYQFTNREASIEKWLIFYPTIMVHNTDHIQTQWFIGYNRLLCRPVSLYASEWKSKLRKYILSLGAGIWFQSSHKVVTYLQLIWNICFFATKKTLIDNPWDEKFTFIYEDLDQSFGAYKQWVQLVSLPDIQINHRETPKDLLAQGYINNPDNVYLKTRHRIWFVLKHANRYQKILFYCCGFRISNLRTLIMILIGNLTNHIGRKKRNKLIQSRRRGIKDGLEGLKI